MSDPTASRPVPPRDASPEGRNRRIPPLIWIIVALLVVWFIIAGVMRRGVDNTPQGGSTPAAAEGSSHMPAAAANGSAPATPEGTVNGPNQPAPR
jgi:hypothetical protein